MISDAFCSVASHTHRVAELGANFARVAGWLAADGCGGFVFSDCAMEATRERDAVLYVGHGEPAGRELLATQRRYIEAFVDAVQHRPGDDPAARRAAIAARMKALLPSDELYFLMELSVGPVAAALGAT